MKGGDNMNFLVDSASLLPALLVVVFLTEAVVEVVKDFVIQMKMSQLFVNFLSIIIAIVLAFALQVSLFGKDNLFAYYVGIVICGLIASRGANYVHNFLDTLPRK
jgi:Ca2+/H+ antiporter